MDIESLPDEALSHVASYLTKTTRALFAASIMAPSKSWEQAIESNESIRLSPPSRVVMDAPFYGPCISNKYKRESCWERNLGRDNNEMNKGGYKEEWVILNFMDIEEHVRMHLTDGDIPAVLICIDGVHNVKTFRLPSCINVIGSFWKVLHGSLVLETVDVGVSAPDDDNSYYEEMKLSANQFVPLLNSIIGNEERKLWRLHIPHEWYDGDNPLANSHLAELLKENMYRIGNAWPNYRMELRVGCIECDRKFYQGKHNAPNQFLCSVERGDKLVRCPDKECCDGRFCLSHHEEFLFQCDNCHETKRECCSHRVDCDCCEKGFCTACCESKEGDSGLLHCGSGCFGSFCRGCTRKGRGKLRECARCNSTWCDCTEFVWNMDGFICEYCQEDEE